MTRKLANQAIRETGNALRLAKAAEDQRDVAMKAEFSSRQPVLVPVTPESENYDGPTILSSGAIWSGHPRASFAFKSDDGAISVRVVLKNVGRGVASLAADREPPEIIATLDGGFQAIGTPTSRTIAPDEEFEIYFKNDSSTSATVSAASWPVGVTPAVVLTVIYTDLTESIEMLCQVWYQLVGECDLQEFKTMHSSPAPVSTPSKVQLFRLRLPRFTPPIFMPENPGEQT